MAAGDEPIRFTIARPLVTTPRAQRGACISRGRAGGFGQPGKGATVGQAVAGTDRLMNKVIGSPGGACCKPTDDVNETEPMR
jgi:hypothetical protein